MAFEEILLSYGPLGAWTIWLLYQSQTKEKREEENKNRLVSVIENNTIAITRVYEVISHYQKIKNKAVKGGL